MADRICSVEGCTAKHQAKGLCGRHYMQQYNAKRMADWGQQRPFCKVAYTDCPHCGRLFVVRSAQLGRLAQAGRLTCSGECSRAFSRVASREWAAANYESYVKPLSRHVMARRRARIRGVAYVENVDVTVLAKRDHYRCHLCGKRVDMKRKSPDRMSPVRDHLIPVALGGEHSYANTKLAHLGCNSRKNIKAMGEQLLLIG